MAPLPVVLGSYLGRIADRLLARDRGSAPSIYWPPGGNGDRGPPGWWQQWSRGGASMPSELTAFSAVYACTSIISQDIGKLDMMVMRDDAEAGVPLRKKGDYYELLMASPNEYQTGVDFLQLYVNSYLLQGNAYAYCTRNMRGEINAMHPLDPRQVQPYIEPESGALFYRCGYNQLAGLEAGAMVPERNIIHHRLPLMPGYPLVGVTPIYAAAASSEVGLRILLNSQSFFSNAARPAGVLTAPGKISKATSERLQEDWDNNYSNNRYGRTAVLPEGLKWEALTMTATDAQLIEQLRWSVEDVGRVFRVPPFLLGDVSKTTYRNSEQLARAYLSNCLGFHVEALEARFTRAFDMDGTPFSMEFNLADMLRAEVDVRFDAYQKALAAGWMTPNEARANESLAPVEGGDEPHIQSQYIPLSQSGKVPPAPGVPAPGAPDAPAPPPGEPSTEHIDVELLRAALGARRLRRAA